MGIGYWAFSWGHLIMGEMDTVSMARHSLLCILAEPGSIYNALRIGNKGV